MGMWWHRGGHLQRERAGGAEPSSHLATRGWELRDCWAWPEGGNGDSDGMGTGQGLCPKPWPHSRSGAALRGTKVAAAPHPGVMPRPPHHVLPNPALPKTHPQPFHLPLPPQLHQHSGGVVGVSWRWEQTPGWDPPPPSSCCWSKNKINPFAPPPKALSDGSIIPVNPCQASLPCLGARPGAGGLLGPPRTVGSRRSPPGVPGGKWGPRRSRKREKEAAPVAGTWGRVGCRVGKCGVQSGVWAPQIHRHPHGMDTPHRPEDAPDGVGGQDSAGGVTSPQNTQRAPKPHRDDPPVPPS